MSDDDYNNYPVGYKRPPQNTQFKKGISGNLKGRPRQYDHNDDVNALLLREMERVISVKDQTGIRQISIKNAVICSLTERALKGNVHAQKHLLARIEAAEEQQAARKAENTEFWRKYVRKTRALMDKAKKDGIGLVDPLPHPDDIIFTVEGDVHINGPMDKEDLKKYQVFCKICDLLLMQDVLDRRIRPETEGSALLMFHLMAKAIPERMLPKDDTSIIMKQFGYEKLTKRELLKQLHQGWNTLGYPIQRGSLTMPLDQGEAYLEMAFDMLKESQKGTLDLAAISRGKIDINAEIFFQKHEVDVMNPAR